MAHQQKGPAQKLSAADFARFVREGALSARDRFGKPLAVDGLVIYQPSDDMVYQITAIQPVLDPRLPGGMVRVELKATAHLSLLVGQPTPHVVLIGKVERGEDAGAGEGEGKGQEAPPPGEPPEGAPPEQPTGIELTDSEEDIHGDSHGHQE